MGKTGVVVNALLKETVLLKEVSHAQFYKLSHSSLFFGRLKHALLCYRILISLLDQKYKETEFSF